ncbi:hypothetical protein AJ85_05670 [Alkalihalobacillus alcalophilus ATCC 27647 = CGMCC 1.3604]|uniref:Uncharacterized protein n=1 Tax=Alkalihalobacillus alcalophilus ATCC 27647 = CGMCC 1.3604 TaxID=1218173 RepID=A0A094WGJ0_ALKAL|nr:hypothetical protein [Alkalihalobacillus alcalophilus]YP_009276838.1 hypothetical protein BH791_gp32 [Bacillus phage BalMu-1]AJA42410.1 hypothetical protein BalMu1_B32 [Bacillus phage BalMu-1]AJA42466.1 hypothetical protein BalMu1_A32 [Bacillus phage BalMu-1]KGA96864.1 hypothetical protein BALCAV_0213680 [Alkalihalobacillus alcalophilus ATCC 27647 = CGMCC 1.3604]MED1561153.1 hypothetical protein [Alkalihalobacillus alcalophilus]THG91311.1 hypothetical protein AJ85_05670 [Alkalihalobacillus
MLARMRKRHIRWSISQDPTTITIKQTGRVRSGGGFREIDELLPPIVVRIFRSNNNQIKQVSELAGTKQLDGVWSMLLDDASNFQTGPNIKNMFEVEGVGKFEVKALYPNVVNGEYVGALCELERVM